MADDAVIERAARALRLSPRAKEALRDTMMDYADEAEHEMRRLGVSDQALSIGDALVEGAIASYICSKLADGQDAQRMEQAWDIRIDELRKTEKYTGGGCHEGIY